MANKEAHIRFEALIKSLMSDLYRYAFWLCRDKPMAEELVQETYLRAWRSLDSLKDEKAAKSWLITILRREYARQFERHRPQIADAVDVDTLSRQGGYDTSTEAHVLRRALAQLADEYREPLVLQVIGGYTAEEIGEILGLSAGAVTTRVFRARQKLRQTLEGDGVVSGVNGGA